jgi:hypothetical protein
MWEIKKTRLPDNTLHWDIYLCKLVVLGAESLVDLAFTSKLPRHENYDAVKRAMRVRPPTVITHSHVSTESVELDSAMPIMSLQKFFVLL